MPAEMVFRCRTSAWGLGRVKWAGIRNPSQKHPTVVARSHVVRYRLASIVNGCVRDPRRKTAHPPPNAVRQSDLPRGENLARWRLDLVAGTSRRRPERVAVASWRHQVR